MNRYIATAIIAVLPLTALAEDWPQFRGPHGRATSPATGLPVEFGPTKNVRWTADLPGRGLSCPVIAGGKLFLTCNSGMDDTRLHVLAFDPATGVKLWERQFWATGPTFCHEKTCMACPTPVADGHSVYCVFSTGDVVALSAAGDVRWVRSLTGEFPKMANLVGRSSSPVLAGGVLAVLMENQGDSFLFAIDPATGTTQWKADRPADNNWSTPLAFERGSDYGWELVIQAAGGMTAYEAKTGKVRWVFDKEKLNQIVTPVAKGDQILATGRGLFALNPSGDSAQIAWKGTKLWSDSPTPVVVGNRVYAVSRPGILKCGDLGDGKQVWDLRIGGTYWSSPIYADGKIYTCSEEGVVSVIKPDATPPKILAANDLKEPLLATPAIYGNALYIRSDKHLWCFAEQSKHQ